MRIRPDDELLPPIIDGFVINMENPPEPEMPVPDHNNNITGDVVLSEIE